MFLGIHPEHDLAAIRERHADLRRLAAESRAFRGRAGRHRFRSRHRRRE